MFDERRDSEVGVPSYMIEITQLYAWLIQDMADISRNTALESIDIPLQTQYFGTISRQTSIDDLKSKIDEFMSSDLYKNAAPEDINQFQILSAELFSFLKKRQSILDYFSTINKELSRLRSGKSKIADLIQDYLKKLDQLPIDKQLDFLEDLNYLCASREKEKSFFNTYLQKTSIRLLQEIGQHYGLFSEDIAPITSEEIKTSNHRWRFLNDIAVLSSRLSNDYISFVFDNNLKSNSSIVERKDKFPDFLSNITHHIEAKNHTVLIDKIHERISKIDESGCIKILNELLQKLSASIADIKRQEKLIAQRTRELENYQHNPLLQKTIAQALEQREKRLASLKNKTSLLMKNMRDYFPEHVFDSYACSQTTLQLLAACVGSGLDDRSLSSDIESLIQSFIYRIDHFKNATISSYNTQDYIHLRTIYSSLFRGEHSWSDHDEKMISLINTIAHHHHSQILYDMLGGLYDDISHLHSLTDKESCNKMTWLIQRLLQDSITTPNYERICHAFMASFHHKKKVGFEQILQSYRIFQSQTPPLATEAFDNIIIPLLRSSLSEKKITINQFDSFIEQMSMSERQYLLPFLFDRVEVKSFHDYYLCMSKLNYGDIDAVRNAEHFREAYPQKNSDHQHILNFMAQEVLAEPDEHTHQLIQHLRYGDIQSSLKEINNIAQASYPGIFKDFVQAYSYSILQCHINCQYVPDTDFDSQPPLTGIISELYGAHRQHDISYILSKIQILQNAAEETDNLAYQDALQEWVIYFQNYAQLSAAHNELSILFQSSVAESDYEKKIRELAQNRPIGFLQLNIDSTSLKNLATYSLSPSIPDSNKQWFALQMLDQLRHSQEPIAPENIQLMVSYLQQTLEQLSSKEKDRCKAAILQKIYTLSRTQQQDLSPVLGLIFPAPPVSHSNIKKGLYSLTNSLFSQGAKKDYLDTSVEQYYQTQVQPILKEISSEELLVWSRKQFVSFLIQKMQDSAEQNLVIRAMRIVYQDERFELNQDPAQINFYLDIVRQTLPRKVDEKVEYINKYLLKQPTLVQHLAMENYHSLFSLVVDNTTDDLQKVIELSDMQRLLQDSHAQLPKDFGRYLSNHIQQLIDDYFIKNTASQSYYNLSQKINGHAAHNIELQETLQARMQVYYRVSFLQSYIDGASYEHDNLFKELQLKCADHRFIDTDDLSLVITGLSVPELHHILTGMHQSFPAIISEAQLNSITKNKGAFNDRSDYQDMLRSKILSYCLENSSIQAYMIAHIEQSIQDDASALCQEVLNLSREKYLTAVEQLRLFNVLPLSHVNQDIIINLEEQISQAYHEQLIPVKDLKKECLVASSLTSSAKSLWLDLFLEKINSFKESEKIDSIRCHDLLNGVMAQYSQESNPAPEILKESYLMNLRSLFLSGHEQEYLPQMQFLYSELYAQQTDPEQTLARFLFEEPSLYSDTVLLEKNNLSHIHRLLQNQISAAPSALNHDNLSVSGVIQILKQYYPVDKNYTELLDLLSRDLNSLRSVYDFDKKSNADAIKALEKLTESCLVLKTIYYSQPAVVSSSHLSSEKKRRPSFDASIKVVADSLMTMSAETLKNRAHKKYQEKLKNSQQSLDQLESQDIHTIIEAVSNFIDTVAEGVSEKQRSYLSPMLKCSLALQMIMDYFPEVVSEQNLQKFNEHPITSSLSEQEKQRLKNRYAGEDFERYQDIYDQRAANIAKKYGDQEISSVYQSHIQGRLKVLSMLDMINSGTYDPYSVQNQQDLKDITDYFGFDHFDRELLINFAHFPDTRSPKSRLGDYLSIAATQTPSEYEAEKMLSNNIVSVQGLPVLQSLSLFLPDFLETPDLSSQISIISGHAPGPFEQDGDHQIPMLALMAYQEIQQRKDFFKRVEESSENNHPALYALKPVVQLYQAFYQLPKSQRKQDVLDSLEAILNDTVLDESNIALQPLQSLYHAHRQSLQDMRSDSHVGNLLQRLESLAKPDEVAALYEAASILFNQDKLQSQSSINELLKNTSCSSAQKDSFYQYYLSEYTACLKNHVKSPDSMPLSKLYLEYLYQVNDEPRFARFIDYVWGADFKQQYLAQASCYQISHMSLELSARVIQEQTVPSVKMLHHLVDSLPSLRHSPWFSSVLPYLQKIYDKISRLLSSCERQYQALFSRDLSVMEPDSITRTINLNHFYEDIFGRYLQCLEYQKSLDRLIERNDEKNLPKSLLNHKHNNNKEFIALNYDVCQFLINLQDYIKNPSYEDVIRESVQNLMTNMLSETYMGYLLDAAGTKVIEKRNPNQPQSSLTQIILNDDCLKGVHHSLSVMAEEAPTGGELQRFLQQQSLALLNDMTRHSIQRCSDDTSHCFFDATYFIEMQMEYCDHILKDLNSARLNPVSIPPLDGCHIGLLLDGIPILESALSCSQEEEVRPAIQSILKNIDLIFDEVLLAVDSLQYRVKSNHRQSLERIAAFVSDFIEACDTQQSLFAPDKVEQLIQKLSDYAQKAPQDQSEIIKIITNIQGLSLSKKMEREVSAESVFDRSPAGIADLYDDRYHSARMIEMQDNPMNKKDR